MAYDVELIQYKGSGREPGQRSSVVELPANAFAAIAAAGRTTLASGTRRVKVKNRVGSQAINVLVEPLAGAVNASAANSPTLSVPGAGLESTLEFALPKGVDASLYCVDIR